MPKIIKQDGQHYVVIGDKAVPCDENGTITQTYSTKKKHPDGRVDCTVHVPCLQIGIKQPTVK